MKLKLVAAIFALAIPALVHAQGSGPQPKPTKADAQNLVQIITNDKVKTQACHQRRIRLISSRGCISICASSS